MNPIINYGYREAELYHLVIAIFFCMSNVCPKPGNDRRLEKNWVRMSELGEDNGERIYEKLVEKKWGSTWRRELGTQNLHG